MMKIIYLLSILFSLFVFQPLKAQEEESPLKFYLVTCDPGKDVASSFGHSAIRMQNSVTGLDLIFNYGTYNFNAPHFLWKFLRGDLDYMLSINEYGRFLANYRHYNRGVIQREIYLTDEQKDELFLFLENNYKPSNRYYRYDFIIDNCATRIRDIFMSEDFTFYNKNVDLTYRENIETYLIERPWLKLGTDLLLAQSVDEKMDSKQEMFLPSKLESNLMKVFNKKEETKLLGGATVLVPKTKDAHFSFFLSPLFIFSIIAFMAIIFLFTNWKILLVYSRLYFFILGIGGIILTFMWFGTNHSCTPNNWNLIWMNPLFLLPSLIKEKSSFREFFVVIIAILMIMFLGAFFFLPQSINIAAIPIAVTLIIFALPYLSKVINLFNRNSR